MDIVGKGAFQIIPNPGAIENLVTASKGPLPQSQPNREKSLVVNKRMVTMPCTFFLNSGKSARVTSVEKNGCPNVDTIPRKILTIPMERNRFLTLAPIVFEKEIS